MKIIRETILSVVNLFFFYPNPNLFGSRKRRKEKESLASEMKSEANEIEDEIETIKAQNPFESASAKSAMTTAARNAKQIGNKYANMMGGNTNPEALVAAQGATQNALASTAGAIAAGSEANQNNQVAQLQSQKNQLTGQYANIKQSAIDERGSGWTSFFQEALPAMGQIASGAGQAAGALGGSGGGGGGGAAALAALSDRRAKENIVPIGTIQGRKIYKFNYKGSKETIIGVIAQDIMKDNPEMVTKDGGMYKVYYDKIFKESK